MGKDLEGEDIAVWARTGLIGGTGFVGGNLRAQRPIARHFSSRTISEISGEQFSTLICAGAPSTMWLANADPERDRDNLRQLAGHIATARFDRLVLISTIAVLDDWSAGYTESSAKFETRNAYGCNRRELEVTLTERHGAVIVRLPALFGNGLRKNFVFDLINPIPSFIDPASFAALLADFTEKERVVATGVYHLDESLQKMRLDRPRLDELQARELLTGAFRRADFISPKFTNSRSEFQFYNLSYLAQDIERCLRASLAVLHVCPEPVRASELYEAFLGSRFENDGPTLVQEDMRSDHAGLWGSRGPYPYRRDQVIAELLQFAREQLA